MSRINSILLTIVSIFLLSTCSKDDLTDYRELYTGRYGGTQISSYYYMDPLDTSLTENIQDTLYSEVLITLASYEDCIVIVYDTIDAVMITDTINLTEDGLFESTFKLIGETYYRYYNVYFEDDSLLIEYDWRGKYERYSYEFRGKKRINP